MSNAGRSPFKRCQVCHRYREDVHPEDSYGPVAGFCSECADNFDRERVARHIRFDRVLSWALCGQELTASDARALGIALCETALPRIRCSKCIPKEPCGSGEARYSRGKKQCPASVRGWSQGRFYCEKHYPPGIGLPEGDVPQAAERTGSAPPSHEVKP